MPDAKTDVDDLLVEITLNERFFGRSSRSQLPKPHESSLAMGRHVRCRDEVEKADLLNPARYTDEKARATEMPYAIAIDAPDKYDATTLARGQ